MPDFLVTPLGKLGTPAFRLGFSATYRPGKDAFHAAIDAGINYFFYFGFDSQMTVPLREAIRGRREKFILATGGYNWILWQSNLRKTLERRLRQLRAGYIDVFLYLGALKGHHWTPRVAEDLQAVKESGLVRAVGLSTHHLPLAAQLAASGAVDAVMIRYNAACRAAEHSLFPLLPPSNPAVLGFTATRWGRLLQRPPGYPPDAPVPTAGMCYRFVLSNPHVHVCLTAPRSRLELERNIAEVRRGPLGEDELRFMRDFGDTVRQRFKYFM